MSRFVLVSSLVVWLAVAPKAVAQIDRTFIVVSGQTSDAVTYYIAGNQLGLLPTDPGGQYYCFKGTLNVGVVGLGVRDALVPEPGLPYISSVSSCGGGGARSQPTVKRTRVNGLPAADIPTDTRWFNWWVSTDTTTWTLLEPTVPVTLHGVTFTALEPGLGSAAGNIPAVGGIGLAVLVAALLGVGAFIITRRRRASVS